MEQAGCRRADRSPKTKYAEPASTIDQSPANSFKEFHRFTFLLNGSPFQSELYESIQRRSGSSTSSYNAATTDEERNDPTDSVPSDDAVELRAMAEHGARARTYEIDLFAVLVE